MAWYKLEYLAKEEFNDVPQSPGVYFVRWSKGGRPVPVHRLGGRDDKGILYVGSSKNLRDRIEQLWKAIEEGFRQHTVSTTFAFCGLLDLVKSSELEASWKVLKSPEEAENQEWAAIYLYCRKYKEPPPLNLRIGRKKYMILDLGELDEAFLAPEADDYVKSVVDP
jgi:hypothetical protein